MSLFGPLDTPNPLAVRWITNNKIKREPAYFSWLIISTGIIVPLLTANTLSPASQYDPFESTGSWVRGQGSTQTFFIVFAEAGVIFTFLKKKNQRANKSTGNQWAIATWLLQNVLPAFPDVACINSHDQRTVKGMDKDQRVKVLLHSIHNENTWMLILT